MANLNNIVVKVASLVNNRVDGDTVFLVDSHMKDALKTVCKKVAMEQPAGHEKLLLEQTAATFAEVQREDYLSFNMSEFSTPFVFTGEFFSAKIRHLGDDIYDRARAVKSEAALYHALSHGKPYYFIKPPFVYVNFPISIPPDEDQTAADLVADLRSFYATHYIYASITQFPEELEDLLVEELVRRILNESQKRQEEAIETPQ